MRLQMLIVGDRDIVRRLRQVATEAKRALVQGLRRAGSEVAGLAKRIVYAGHPEHLEGDTGRLRQSIQTVVDEHALTAHVGSNVIYAPVHEYGAIIEPVDAPILAWRDKRTGEWRRAMRVRIPARPYLRPSLEEKEAELGDIILRPFEELFTL